jgi:hypothetical protein
LRNSSINHFQDEVVGNASRGTREFSPQCKAMIREAEEFAEEDARARAGVDARVSFQVYLRSMASLAEGKGACYAVVWYTKVVKIPQCRILWYSVLWYSVLHCSIVC